MRDCRGRPGPAAGSPCRGKPPQGTLCTAIVIQGSRTAAPPPPCGGGGEQKRAGGGIAGAFACRAGLVSIPVHLRGPDAPSTMPRMVPSPASRRRNQRRLIDGSAGQRPYGRVEAGPPARIEIAEPGADALRIGAV